MGDTMMAALFLLLLAATVMAWLGWPHVSIGVGLVTLAFAVLLLLHHITDTINLSL